MKNYRMYAEAFLQKPWQIWARNGCRKLSAEVDGWHTEGCWDKNAARSLDRFQPKKNTDNMEKKIEKVAAIFAASWMAPRLFPSKHCLAGTHAWRRQLFDQQLRQSLWKLWGTHWKYISFGFAWWWCACARQNESKQLNVWTLNVLGSKNINQLRVSMWALDAKMIGWQR